MGIICFERNTRSLSEEPSRAAPRFQGLGLGGRRAAMLEHRKRLDVRRLHALDWRAETDLRTGLQQAYDWFLANRAGILSEATSSSLSA